MVMAQYIIFQVELSHNHIPPSLLSSCYPVTSSEFGAVLRDRAKHVLSIHVRGLRVILISHYTAPLLRLFSSSVLPIILNA